MVEVRRYGGGSLKNHESRKITKCRSCKGTSFLQVNQSGSVPVAGIYYDPAGSPTDVCASLSLACCLECGLIQLEETISPHIYDDYSFVGNSAAAYQLHLEYVADWLAKKWEVSGKRVFEVGASNGVLLGHLSGKYGNHVSGIEPSRKLCESAAMSGVSIECGYFNSGYLAQAEIGVFDCVIIRHVLEHIDDLEDMLQSLQRIVKRDGVLIVEVPDGGRIFRNRLFSNVFHEHLNYFTQSSIDNLMNRYGFSPAASEEVDIHGGALLMAYKPDVTNTRLSTPVDQELLKRFSGESARYYRSLYNSIMAARGSGKVVHGYGASHRTFILLGNAGLDQASVPVIYDNNPMLHGKRLNGFHIEVRPAGRVKEDNPDAIVIFATSYENEIRSFLADECDYRGEIISVGYGELCEEDQ